LAQGQENLMAKDQSGSADLSETEREASEKASRKRLGENGYPQDKPTPDKQNAADRSQTTVKHIVKRGSQEADRTAGEK
jgi:hypothetical protein